MSSKQCVVQSILNTSTFRYLMPPECHISSVFLYTINFSVNNNRDFYHYKLDYKKRRLVAHFYLHDVNACSAIKIKAVYTEFIDLSQIPAGDLIHNRIITAIIIKCCP